VRTITPAIQYLGSESDSSKHFNLKCSFLIGKTNEDLKLRVVLFGSTSFLLICGVLGRPGFAKCWRNSKQSLKVWSVGMLKSNMVNNLFWVVFNSSIYNIRLLYYLDGCRRLSKHRRVFKIRTKSKAIAIGLKTLQCNKLYK
jgi:hypothetical protein